MEKLVRCKACGYIMKEKKLGGVCPACGVPRKSFEPYTDRLSARRRLIIELNLHPISVHFPQAFATVLPFLLIISLFVPYDWRRDLICASRILSYLLPLSVIGAFAAGLLDGHTRFKRLDTPALVRKIITGGILLLLSAVLAVMVYNFGLNERYLYAAVVLSSGCVACEIVLGQIGKKLLNSQLPG